MISGKYNITSKRVINIIHGKSHVIGDNKQEAKDLSRQRINTYSLRTHNGSPDMFDEEHIA